MKRILFFLLAIAALVVGCKDDDSFSADVSSSLSFSRDSIALDTLFSDTPSSTTSFWAYNHTDSGLRISQVRLKNASSYFRVNVDGVYVDSVAYDFEIRKGDSICVFVEVTPPLAGQEEPRYFEDQIVFTLESGREQAVVLTAWSWDPLYVDELVVDKDTTITTTRPVVVKQGIVVKEDATLTLEGMQLFFNGKAGVTVNGTLIAKDCLFRGDRLDRMFNNLPYDRVSGQWKGITIGGMSQDNVLENCEIRNASDAVVCQSGASLALYDTAIHNCMGDGLSMKEAVVTMANCRITNTAGDCLTMEKGIVNLDHVTLAQFYPFIANRGVAMRFDEESMVDCQNCLLTGYEDDVIMGAGESFSFVNCIIRTPEPADLSHFTDVTWETSKDEVQGKDHFVLFDTDDLIYNFSIKEESPAFSKGIGDLRTL